MNSFRIHQRGGAPSATGHRRGERPAPRHRAGTPFVAARRAARHCWCGPTGEILPRGTQPWWHGVVVTWGGGDMCMCRWHEAVVTCRWHGAVVTWGGDAGGYAWRRRSGGGGGARVVASPSPPGPSSSVSTNIPARPACEPPESIDIVDELEVCFEERVGQCFRANASRGD